VPEVRQIEADGMRSPIIGSTVFDSWEVTLSTTLKEVTRENLAYALATSEIDPITGAMIINNTLLPDHYIPTMGWAGRILDGRLLYIEIQNALNIVGMNLTFTDKGEGTIAVEYRAHQADLTQMQYAPVKIYFFDRTPAAIPPTATPQEKMEADRTAILADTYEIPTSEQGTQEEKTAWVQAQVETKAVNSTVVVTYSAGDYSVQLSIGIDTIPAFTIAVTEEF